MYDSELRHLITEDPTLHNRIDSIVKGAMHTSTSMTQTERALMRLVLMSGAGKLLAEAAVSNPTIFDAVKSALTGEDVAAAVATGLNDTDLEYVVVTEIRALAP